MVGIPAYNVEQRVEDTVRRVLRQPVTSVVIVNDGSTDGTASILERLAQEGRVTVIHQANQGYGAVHKRLLDEFRSGDGDYFVMVHGDGQHAPEEIVALLRALRDGADVVLGSRALGDMRGGGMPLYKYIGNRVLTSLENAVFNTRITSFHCGYKACNRRSVLEVPYHDMTDGFHFDGQFLVATCKLGLKLAQVPVTTIYHPNGVSHLRPLPYLIEVVDFMISGGRRATSKRSAPRTPAAPLP
jgi:glycosyltransferase involved in cell wall biosynthesis